MRIRLGIRRLRDSFSFFFFSFYVIAHLVFVPFSSISISRNTPFGRHSWLFLLPFFLYVDTNIKFNCIFIYFIHLYRLDIPPGRSCLFPSFLSTRWSLCSLFFCFFSQSFSLLVRMWQVNLITRGGMHTICLGFLFRYGYWTGLGLAGLCCTQWTWHDLSVG